MKKRLLACVMAVACSLPLVGCDKVKNIIGDDTKVGVTIVTHPLEAKEGETVYATGCYPEIILSEEYADSFPNLASTIADSNSSWAESAKSTVADFGHMNKDYAEEEAATSGEYIDENTLEVVRADSKLFSVLLSSYSDADSAHPSHYNFSLNIDTTTGHRIGLDEVVTDKEALWKKIREKIFEKYPENKEEIENYLVCECAMDGDPFEIKMSEDSYTWTMSYEGIHIYFSPYEIASYAAGDMDVVISDDDIPGIIQKNYKLSKKQDLESIVTKETAETETVAPQKMGDGEDYEYDGGAAGITVANPTWHKYVSDSAKPAAAKHITLTETSKDTSEWLDTSVWREKNGFEEPFLSYGDGNYYYAPGDGGDWGYEFTTLFLYDYETNELLHTYDMSVLCNGPDEEEGKESSQYIHWAKAMDGVLYVSLAHNGYTSEAPWSGYMVAIDMSTDKVLWRSEPQVSNACNFQIVDDTIICGYGFTAEPDYLYLLDKNTGEKVEQIKLESAADQFEIKDDTLYVATYNTAYTYQINR